MLQHLLNFVNSVKGNYQVILTCRAISMQTVHRSVEAL